METAALMDALTNYYHIQSDLDRLQESDNKRLDSLDDAWDPLFAMNHNIHASWDRIMNRYEELRDIISTLDEDQELPEEYYPDVRYTRRDYTDMLRFGRDLTEYFDRFRRFLPKFYDVDDFYVLRDKSELTYADLLDAYNMSYGRARG